MISTADEPTPLRAARQALLLFVACAAVFFVLLHRHPALMDPDALYHYKLSALILERGPWVDVSWLPFTVLGEHGPDHHWLFHVLVAPLTLMGRDFDAVTFAAAVVGALVPAALFLMLRAARTPWPWLFAIVAVLASDVMPARVLMLRTQNLAVILMVASLFALCAHRRLVVGILAFLFMQSYHGAVILAVLTAAALAAQLVLERRIDLKLPFAVIVGTAAGLLASPWFPENVGYLIFHTFFKVASGQPHLVGSEWYRVPLDMLATESLASHLVLLSGIVAVIAARRDGPWPKVSVDTLAFLATTVVFLVLYAFAWRFAEYYSPFAVVTAALLWRDALARKPLEGRARAVLPAALVVVMAWGLVAGAARMESGMRYRFGYYAEMMREVNANDPKPMVFNSGWPDFVRLFYWSDNARFVAGLDGHYLLYGSDVRKFQAWNAIVSGATAGRNDNARVIRDTFGAGWAVIPRAHGAIAASLARDPQAKLVIENEDGWLFRLVGP